MYASDNLVLDYKLKADGKSGKLYCFYHGLKRIFYTSWDLTGKTIVKVLMCYDGKINESNLEDQV
jgi:hypothetical protein